MVPPVLGRHTTLQHCVQREKSRALAGVRSARELPHEGRSRSLTQARDT